METWYFTFGSNHIGELDGALTNCYMTATGTFNEARQKIWEVTSGKFAFQYSEDQKASSIDKWNLREVPLQLVTN